MSRPQTEITQVALAAEQAADDPSLWDGPAFSKPSAAEYLDLTVRGVDQLEEQGLLQFQRIGKRSVRTTKTQCDRLLRLGAKALLNGEGDPK